LTVAPSQSSVDEPVTLHHTLSLHDALPIYHRYQCRMGNDGHRGSAFYLAHIPYSQYTPSDLSIFKYFHLFDPLIFYIIFESQIKIGRHTSELQSRENLVCLLLLEQKKAYQL